MRELVCDKCGKRIKPSDVFEYQEVYTICFEGGYGSVYGDGNYIELDLCQHCLFEMIGDLVNKRHEKENGVN